MRDLQKAVEKITSMDDFLDFLKILLKYHGRLDFSWRNYDLDPFLRGIGTALAEQMSDQEPSWYLFGKTLMDAATIEPEFGD